jgi:hypothetical protein
MRSRSRPGAPSGSGPAARCSEGRRGAGVRELLGCVGGGCLIRGGFDLRGCLPCLGGARLKLRLHRSHHAHEMIVLAMTPQLAAARQEVFSTGSVVHVYI